MVRMATSKHLQTPFLTGESWVAHSMANFQLSRQVGVMVTEKEWHFFVSKDMPGVPPD